MSLWTLQMEGEVAIATYLNPPMNYFCAAGALELAQLIEEFRAQNIRAVILTGGLPGKFITHYSVEELLAYAEDQPGMQRMGTALTENYHQMLLGLRDLPKPVIVAMNGDTMGGGFELSLACDLRIGARGDHRFGLPEAKLGILPGGSGTQRLSRLIGAGRAIEFILRGRVVRPEEALALALIHEIADDALLRAREIAREMVALPPRALAMVKRSVYQGSDVHLSAGLKIESGAFFETMLTADAIKAMRAYVAEPLERRRDWLERPTGGPYDGQ